MPSTPDKLIALDLDGTLLREPDLSITPENLAAINRAREAGAIVAIVTGRPYVSACAVISQVGVKAPIVAFNGAVIREPDGGAILHQSLMPADLAAEAVEECVARRLHLHYYLGDDMYVARCSHWALHYCARAMMPCVPRGDLRKFAGEQPVKLLVVDYPDRINALLPVFEELWRDRLYVTRTMPHYLELMNPDATKGNALEWLMEHFSIPQERTMAAGDRLNDLPLLEAAAYRVVMPEAEEELRGVAQFVPSNQPTGVAEGIDWFLRELGS
jgi:Cof subfamily protein (haloacid dehalogenase superfamily)